MDAVRDAPQNTLAFKGRQAASSTEGFYRGGDCSLGVFAASLVDVGNHGPVKRGANFDDITFFQPLSVHIKNVGCNWNHRHLAHVSTSSPLIIGLRDCSCWRRDREPGEPAHKPPNLDNPQS